MSARSTELRRLAYGTTYFGQLGELAYDRDEDRVQCHLCGGWFRLLGSSHLRRTHGWTLQDYREAFHLPVKVPTCSRELSARHGAYARSQIERRTGFGEGIGMPVAQRPPVRVPRWRSLAARPDLGRELHPERNSTVPDTSAIAAKSSRKLWWLCERCGHDWEATVGSRAAGSGCPECDHERKPPAENDRSRAIAASEASRPVGRVAPDPQCRSRPGEPQPGVKASGLVVLRRVRARVADGGAEPCSWKRLPSVRTQPAFQDSERGRAGAVEYPKVAAELHPQRNPGIDPIRLGARSGLKLWWQCATCGHAWKTAVAARTAGGTGCPVCALKRRSRTQSVVAPARSLAVKHPNVAAELHPQRNPGIDPTRLGARSSLKLWWQCASCGHAWKTAVSTRTDGCGCPACYRAKV